MKKYEAVLRSVGLFKDIMPKELASMLRCLQVQISKFKKGEYLLMAGSKPENVGILLSGQLYVTRDDIEGGRTLLATLTASDIFGEALCCATVEESPVSVMAEVDSTVMLLKFSRILHTCPNSCEFHQKLIANMLRMIAQKNLYLQSRIEIIRTKSVRAKVVGYLDTFGAKRGDCFTIPLNREEMADYLCVERSALSHELMRMKRNGLIDYHKNKFTLL